MKIPRIIHQTWKDESIPEKFIPMARSWRENHTGWEYLLWTDAMNRALISEHFPFFLRRYDQYPHNIQRVDAVRYFILQKYGGICVDLDLECLLNVAPLIGDAGCVLGKEPIEHCRIHGKDRIISNAFMAAVPGHRFIRSVCAELEVDRVITDHRNDMVLESTGPFMLSRMYEVYGEKEDVLLLEADTIYPLSKEELSAYGHDGLLQDRLEKAYAIHYYAGTWWKPAPAFTLFGDETNKG